MYCYKCGQQLADNASFCSKCGTAMGQPQQAAPQPQPQPQPAPQAAPMQPQQAQWQPVPPQPQQQPAYAPPQGYGAPQPPAYAPPPAAVVPPPTQAPIPAERPGYTAPAQTQAPPPPQPVVAPPAAPAASTVWRAQPPPQPEQAQPQPVPPQPQPVPPPVAAPTPAPLPVAATVSPAAVGLDAALQSGLTVVPKRNKTGMDMICGVVFLALGIGALAIYGFATAALLMGGGLNGMFPFLRDLSDIGFLSSLLSLGYIFGLAAGVLMTLGGVFALISGRGRKPAYTAIVLMLFTLAFDVVYLLLMDMWGYLSLSIGQTVMRSFFIYAFEVVFVLVPTVMLMLKKRAKKRAHTTLVLQTDDNKRKGKAQLAPPVEPTVPVPTEDPAGTDAKAEASLPTGMDVPLPATEDTAPATAAPMEPEDNK